MYRQGDVLLRPTSIPDDAEFIPRAEKDYPEVKGIVLAAGEVTGHHHVIADRFAREYRRGSKRFVRVNLRRGSCVTHEEHATITVPPGEYEIVRQTEYEPPRTASGKLVVPAPRYVYD